MVKTWYKPDVLPGLQSFYQVFLFSRQLDYLYFIISSTLNIVSLICWKIKVAKSINEAVFLCLSFLINSLIVFKNSKHFPHLPSFG